MGWVFDGGCLTSRRFLDRIVVDWFNLVGRLVVSVGRMGVVGRVEFVLLVDGVG